MTTRIKYFNDYCRNTKFSMSDKITAMINTLDNNKFIDIYDLTIKEIYNDNSNILKPILSDLCRIVRYLRDTTEYTTSEEVLNTFLGDCINYVSKTYQEDIDALIRYNALHLIFDEFEIKCDIHHNSKTINSEVNEYFKTILHSVEKRITEPHALLPIISVVEMEDILYEIIPRSSNNYNPGDLLGIKYWTERQNRARLNILGEGISEQACDLDFPNIGYYNEELHILDVAAMKPFDNEDIY